MSESLLVGLCTAILSALGSMVLVNWRLKSLETKVDEHNGYAKKFAECTKDIALVQKDIQYIKENLKKD